MNKRLKKKKMMNRGCKYELGNLFFGNSRGEYSVPREWQNKMYMALEEMGFDCYGYYEGKNKYVTDRGGYENEVFLINPYYWGEYDMIAGEPNFIFKPNDYRLDWYKYPLRDSYANKEVAFQEFARMLKLCVKSVEDDKNSLLND